MSLTGYAPIIVISIPTNQSITPATGRLQLGIEEPLSSLNFVGYPPIVTISGGTAVITPLAGSLTLTGRQPTVNRTANVTITPQAGSLATTGAAPTVQRTANVVRTPIAGALSLAGLQPTVQSGNNNNVIPTTGSLSLAGNQPTLQATANVVITPVTGALVIIGQPGMGGGSDALTYRKIITLCEDRLTSILG